MTSNIRLKLSRKVIECLGNNSATTDLIRSTVELAASMSIAKVKKLDGISSEICLHDEYLKKQFGCDSHIISSHLSLDPSEFPYVKRATNKTSSLVFGINNNFMIKEVLSSIINSSNLWKDNVSFSRLQKLKVIVEFSSPNIAKPFHAGHLKSTILGNFVANIHESAGHEVVRLNYLGDWGTQFGLLSKGYQLFGDSSKLQTDPIQHLYEVYVEANKLSSGDEKLHSDAMTEFWKLENGDPVAMKQWLQFRQLSIADLTKTYSRLGIRFDNYEGESMYRSEVPDVYTKLCDQGLLKELADGKRVIEFKHPSGVRDVVLQKSDGTSLYLTRDIAAAISRMNRYNFDRLYYVVENGQNDHFLALFDVLKRLDYDWASRMMHIKFGRVRGLSTRKGTTVFLRDILNEAKSLTIEAMRKSPNTRIDENRLDEIGDVLGVASVMINDMRNRRLQDSDFNWNKITQTKGDTGVFLLYVHARLCSLEDSCGVAIVPNCDLSYLVEPDIVDVIYQLARYEEVCASAYSELQPCILVQYLFSLGRTVNKALDSIRVKDQPKELAAPRLLQFMATRKVLADGLEVLGLCPLRQM